jgi:hypothetical protein
MIIPYLVAMITARISGVVDLCCRVNIRKTTRAPTAKSIEHVPWSVSTSSWVQFRRLKLRNGHTIAWIAVGHINIWEVIENINC